MKKISSSILALLLILATSQVSHATPASPESTLEIALNGEDVSLASSDGLLSTKQGDSSSNREVLTSENYAIETGNVDSNSFQIILKIESPEAPSSFEFKLNGAEKIQHLDINGLGIYKILDSQGEIVAWVAEPWARDASGQSVPTHFEVSRNLLTQVVDINTPGIQFPVTADPYFGIDLISSVSFTVDKSSGERNLHIAVTPWLGTQYAISAGPWSYTVAVEIAVTYGWPEAISKFASKYGSWMRTYINSKPTFASQWACHAQGAPVIFLHGLLGDPNSTWDLEGSRTTTYDLAVWINTHCNW